MDSIKSSPKKKTSFHFRVTHKGRWLIIISSYVAAVDQRVIGKNFSVFSLLEDINKISEVLMI